MSLLARMLSTASSIPNSTLDSNLEDQFTYNLLFPGPEALCHKDQIFQLTSDAETTAFASKFDLDTKFNIDLCDVRVIIMQDVTPQSGSPYLLYDSHTPSSSDAEGQENHNSPKKGHRRFQSRNYSNYMETDAQRTTREYQEEMTTFSNCIFGNSEILAHKGTGTKVHILPLVNNATHTSRSYAGDGSILPGKPSACDSKLANSLTSEPAHTQGSFRLCATNTTFKKSPERKKILITRTFPVHIMSDNFVESKIKTRISLPKQTKTPMYAVGLVINSPPTTASPTAHNIGSSYQTPSSLLDRDNFSSFNSTQWPGSTKIGHGYDMESADSTNFNEFGSQIDVIAHHWDVITRTLTYLQAEAMRILSPMLGRAFLSSVDPQRKLTSENSTRCPMIEKNISNKLKPLEIPRLCLKMVKLDTNCLMQAEKMCSAVDESRRRILTGLSARQVVTGQERWGIWRDQARAVCRWSDRKDQDFLHFLLTAFLGNHTDWIQVMAPDWYRQKFYQQQILIRDEDAPVRSRTIIVSNDKVLARRLIFLLSSFLHPDQKIDSNALFRPGTSISSGAYSISPSNSPTAFLREGFPRQVSKRAAGNDRIMQTRSPSKQGEFRYHSSGLIKSANLPIPGSDIIARKSSVATVSTATPITSLPYFSTGSASKETKPMVLSTRGASPATDDLIRLNKGHHLVEPQRQKKYSGWGDVISDIWKGSSKTKPSSRHMAAKKSPTNNSPPRIHSLQECPTTLDAEIKIEKKNEESESATNTDQILHPAQRIPDPSGAYESPVKTSINRIDGIIDIDVQLPDYLHYDNNLNSPYSSGDPSSIEFGGRSQLFEHSPLERSVVADHVNVGGWLPQYSPDFTLQAVPGYDGIIEEIKASLQAEKTPSVGYHNSDKWIDIGSAIVADTRNLSVKHILYRRSICPGEANYSAPVCSYGSSNKNHNETSHQMSLDDKVTGCFFEETISSMEKGFAEVVKKIVASNGNIEDTLPETFPKSNFQVKGLVDSGISVGKYPIPIKSNHEVPRNKCKHIVLGALEEIIKDISECRGSVHKKGEENNYLRTSVKNWLSSVENAAL
ncbi:hypothetical protein GcM3_210035 [Golovinomyces cichoracearum]|uniref:Folliculin-interacting protein N-terminal domain-containing protein n=1 Tax=Golovinomyces cichoracearum TaxID=62708 RepID=A0A420HA59_9PEZI|nr:hypothetical protein GcM3_210035 [Golovinomyces cichoracearum]